MRGHWSRQVTDEQYKERLKGRCIITPSGCWEYQGFRRKPPRHYGEMSYRCENWATHRLTYLLYKGPIPKGFVVMHSCDNPPCCNPGHLSLGTHLQNMSDCRAKDRYYYANLTHCKRGHPFDEKNTYYMKTPGPMFGLRACKACQLGRLRIRAGWPEHLAYDMSIKVPKGMKLDFETMSFVPSARGKRRQQRPDQS